MSARLTYLILPGLNGGAELLGKFVAALGGDAVARVVEYPRDPALDYDALMAQVNREWPVESDVVLIAESFSGPLAIRFAASRPRGLRALVLCASFARAPRPMLRFAEVILPLLPMPAPRRLPMVLWRWLVLGRCNDASLRERVRVSVSTLDARLVKARLRMILREDVRDLIKGIDVPLLYLRATRDRLVPAARAREIVAAHRQATTLAFDAPHFLLQVAPREAASAITAFVTTTLAC